MKVKNWIENQHEIYNFKLVEQKGDNHFVSSIYNINGINNTEFPFTLYADENGMPSGFNSSLAPFAYFNIAEGVSGNDILRAAGNCLSGELIFKRSWLRKSVYYIEFNFETFKGKARLSPSYSSDKLIKKYCKGYTKK